MNSKSIILTAALCITASISSCSVKEDRSACPCILDIWPGNAYGRTDELLLSGWNGNGTLVYRTECLEDDMDPFWETPVSRSIITCSAVGLEGTDEDLRLTGHEVNVPDGEDFQPVWAHVSRDVDCTGETAEDQVNLHKQHAWLHMRTNRSEWTDERIAVRVIGTVSGMDLLDLSPVDGPFSCDARVDGDGNYLVCLPRQKDTSLALEVFLGGSLFAVIPLGEIIEQTGYDWASTDLEDIWLELSLAERLVIEVMTNGWTPSEYTFVI